MTSVSAGKGIDGKVMVLKKHILVITALSTLIYVGLPHVGKLYSYNSADNIAASLAGIHIISASFGLECESADSIKGIYKNNALDSVTALCERETSCSIPFNREFLGDIYTTQCFGKSLIVEYRCYNAIPGKQLIKTSAEALIIHCDNSM